MTLLPPREFEGPFRVLASGAISHGRQSRELTQGYVVVLTVFDLTVLVKPAVIVPPVMAVAVKSVLTCICMVRSFPCEVSRVDNSACTSFRKTVNEECSVCLSDCVQFRQDSITHFNGTHLFHAVLHDVTGTQALVERRGDGGFNSAGPVAHAERIAQAHGK